MKDTAVWQAMPSDEQQSVWHETERNFWDRFKRDTETERSAANARFHNESVDIRVELRHFTDLRMQLSDRRSRMAREMAQVEEDLARAAAACHEKATKLTAMEQEYRESLHVRMETREEVCKSMTNFFREKRGQLPLNELGPRLPRIESRDQEEERMNDSEANGVPTPARSTSTENVLVNVVDADGRYVGPVERIEPWNQWVEAIQDLPVQRPVIIRRGRRFNKDHLTSIYERAEAKGVKWLSCMIQAIGEVQKRRCHSCEKNQGAFENCVIVGGEMFPKCGNCEWNRQGCHGASAEWIDMQAAQEHAKRKRLLEPPTPTEKEPEAVKAKEAPQEPTPDHRAQVAREEAHRLAAEEGKRQMRLKEAAIQGPSFGVPRVEPRRHAGLTPPPQGLEDERIARMAMARMAGLNDQPLPRPTHHGSPILPPLTRREGSGYVDPIRHMNNDHPIREIPPPNGPMYHHHEHQRRPLPKEPPRPYMGFTPANIRSRPASHELTPAPISTEASPRQAPHSPEEPLTEITSKNLILRHNGTVYTYPECMQDVPVGKIDKDHPYWESHWKDVRKDITRQWERWKEKHQATIEAEARGEKGGSSKYQIGRQVNRGAKILEFLDSGKISPYQLLAKRFLHTSKGGITSYDTLFRLSESLSELEKFNLDVTPVEWLRHRLHEIYELEGPNFNMPRTIHDFYHDKKLASLRAKAGFRNIGRPSGKSVGGSAPTSSTNTPQGTLGKRKSMHWSTEQPMETTFINQSPGTAMGARFRNIILPESHFNKRPKSNHSNETPARSAEPISDAEANTGVLLTEDDFRICQAKTKQFASPNKLSQYVRIKKGSNGVSLDFRVLGGSGPSEKWMKPEVDGVDMTSIDLTSTCRVKYNRQALKVSLRADPEASPKQKDLLLEFKRESTLLRFIDMCKRHNSKDGQVLEFSNEEIEREWKEFDAGLQLDGSEKLIPVDA
ncbi:hypothetical protein CC79DRAFT_1322693 [Sarocladium strictum]